MDSGEMNVQ